MKERIFGLQKNIFFLGLTSLFNDFSSEMVVSVFPAFFASVLRAGAESLGLVDGIAEAASNFFKIYSGALSDRIQSRKPLVVAGYTLSVVTRPFFVLVSSVGGALGLRFTDRIGKGLRDAPRDAIISLSVSKEELGRSFGYHRAMDTVGAILGPLAAYLILLRFPMHFNAVFITAFVVGIASVVTLAFISDVAAVAGARKNLLTEFSGLSPQFRKFLFAMFILSAGSLPIAVMLLKTESIGLVIADIPLFYMIYNISYAALSMPAGKLSDRVGARSVIILGYAFLIAGYGMIAIADSVSALAIGFFVMGLFPACTDGVVRAFASELTAENVRGGGMGWINAVSGFGALLAGIGGGYIWQTYGPSAAFGASSVVVIAGIIALSAVSKKRQYQTH
ncbi:MAG TPA: MFS transporter [Candidatus Paceibacterota bacterium]